MMFERAKLIDIEDDEVELLRRRGDPNFQARHASLVLNTERDSPESWTQGTPLSEIA